MKIEEFRQHVLHCANTGNLVKLPDSLDRVTCGNIMADIAGRFVDQGESIKAIMLLNERQRLGV